MKRLARALVSEHIWGLATVPVWTSTWLKLYYKACHLHNEACLVVLYGFFGTARAFSRRVHSFEVC